MMRPPGPRGPAGMGGRGSQLSMGAGGPRGMPPGGMGPGGMGPGGMGPGGQMGGTPSQLAMMGRGGPGPRMGGRPSMIRGTPSMIRGRPSMIRGRPSQMGRGSMMGGGPRMGRGSMIGRGGMMGRGSVIMGRQSQMGRGSMMGRGSVMMGRGSVMGRGYGNPSAMSVGGAGLMGMDGAYVAKKSSHFMHLPLAIVGCLCCPLMGGLALFFSSASTEYKNQGDAGKQKLYATMSAALAVLSIFMGFAIYVVLVIYLAVYA